MGDCGNCIPAGVGACPCLACCNCGGIFSFGAALTSWAVAGFAVGVHAVLLGTLVVSGEISETTRKLTPMLIVASVPKDPVADLNGEGGGGEGDWYGMGVFGGCRRVGGGETVCARYSEYGTGVFAGEKAFEEYAKSKAPLMGGLLGLVAICMIAHFIILILYNSAVGPHKILVKAKAKIDAGNPTSYLSKEMTKTVLTTVKHANKARIANSARKKEMKIQDVRPSDWARALEFAEKRANKYRRLVDTWYFDFALFVIMMLLVGVITLAFNAPNDGELRAMAGLSTALILIFTAAFYAIVLVARMLTHGMTRGEGDKDNEQGGDNKKSKKTMTTTSRPYA